MLFSALIVESTERNPVEVYSLAGWHWNMGNAFTRVWSLDLWRRPLTTVPGTHSVLLSALIVESTDTKEFHYKGRKSLVYTSLTYLTLYPCISQVTVAGYVVDSSPLHSLLFSAPIQYVVQVKKGEGGYFKCRHLRLRRF